MNPRIIQALRGFSVVRWIRGGMTRLLARPLRRRPDARHFRAAIVKMDLIGDFVLALSAVRLALAHYGEEHCLLVVSPQVEPLAAAEFPRTPRLVLPPSVGHKLLWWAGWRARRLLRGYICAETVCLRHQRWDWDELVLGWLAAERSHVLYDEQSLAYYRERNTHPRLTTPPVPAAPADGPAQLPEGKGLCRELGLHRQLLSAVLQREVTMEEILPEFSRTDRERSPRGRGIGVTPYSSATCKDFPEDLLLQALRELRKHTDESIRLWGAGDQQSRLQRLAARLRDGGVTGVECLPPRPLADFVHEVAEVRLVLTADTATAHIATALDRPTLVLIGGGHYGQFGPWRKSSRQVWLTHRLDCFGCSWNCIHPEPYCLTKIEAAAVCSTVAQLWSQEAVP